MTISATSVRFDDDSMWVELTDWPHARRSARVVSASAPRHSTQRAEIEISRVGLHWEAIDEDISVAGLLAGRGDVTRSTERWRARTRGA